MKQRQSERISPALNRLRDHPQAPAWNHAAGDRLDESDLLWLYDFSATLPNGGTAIEAGQDAPDWLIARAARWQRTVAAFRQRLPVGLHLARDWEAIPTSGRFDLASAPEQLVPDDAELSPLLIYRTAGTTGEALHVPHHARAVAAYCPLLGQALMRWGCAAQFSASDVACLLLGAQRHTVTYATSLAAWQHAGFAKLNLDPAGWPSPDSAHAYLADMAPRFVTGDPIAYTELLRREIRFAPQALVTTAVAMNRHLRQKLVEHFAAPVIDWYSLTETGPLGYACRDGHGFHLLCPDVAVEVIDPEGQRVAPGERGEIAVSGGRNPYVPLLRYRTGDWGRLDTAPCSCGDASPRLMELEGRAPVRLIASDGTAVNTVDVSRVLREFPILKHQFVQHADYSLRLDYRPLPAVAVDEDGVRSALAGLFGTLPLNIVCDPDLGARQLAGKVAPYRSELLDD